MIIKSDLVAAFGQKCRYFNTFGGNIVSAAVGAAVLSVIKDEGLLESAARVGPRFQAELRKLAAFRDRIGEVRGSGLYLGVELVADRDSKAPGRKGPPVW